MNTHDALKKALRAAVKGLSRTRSARDINRAFSRVVDAEIALARHNVGKASPTAREIIDEIVRIRSEKAS